MEASNHKKQTGDENNSILSFSFTKKKDKIKLITSGLINESEDRNVTVKKEFVTYLDVENKVGSSALTQHGNTSISSVKDEQISERMVIPLITQNKWRYGRELGTKKVTLDNETTDELQRQAVDELISESLTIKEDDEVVNSSLAIPILMKNKVPDGFETEDRLDVALRPSEPQIADYDEVPLEVFGMAMLRGMGWNDGEGVGKDKKMVAPIDAVLRPKGLGLGADRGAAMQLNTAKQGQQSGDKHADKLQLTKGVCCVITTGLHKDLYGVLQGIDEDNARVMIKLAIGGQMITCSQYAISLVTKQEYDKSSKVLNKRKVDQYKEEQEKRRRVREKSADKDDRNDDRHQNRENKTHSERKRKHKERYKDDDDDKDGKDEHDKVSHRKDKHRKQSDSGSSDREMDRRHGKHDRDSDSLKSSSRKDRDRSPHHHHKHKHSKHRDRDRDDEDTYGHDSENRRTKSDDKHMSHRHREDDGDSSVNSDDSDIGDNSRIISSNRVDNRKTQRADKMEAKIKNIRNMTSSVSSNGNRDVKLWLLPQIRVRIIDRKYKKGQFYNTKVDVVDVVSGKSCVCQTDTGTILEGLSQTMLETVVPRDADAFVLVVSGKYSGQLAQICNKDKEKCRVTVQMLRDRDDVITLDYEAICEYTGDINDEFDY